MSITKQEQALLQQLQQKTQAYLNLYQAHAQHLDAADAKQMQQIRALAQRLDTVIGYDEMAKDDEGKNTKYAFAQKVLAQNKEFVTLMQQFANPDIANSDNFGATEKGEFGDIILEFETLTGDEILQKYRAGAKDIAFKGAVISQISTNGKWIMAEVFKGKREDIKDLDKDIRILAVFNIDKAPDNEANMIDPILVISHEIAIHAKAAAERIKAFKDGENNLKEWQSAIIDATDEQRSVWKFSKEHQDIENGNNADYEAINDESYRILSQQYRNVMVPQDDVYPAWHDRAGQNKGKHTDNLTPEKIDEGAATVFNKLRQNERLEYVSPDDKNRTTDFIQNEELPRIEKLNKKN